jgi:hypothetical protein
MRRSRPLIAALTRIIRWDVRQPYPVGRDCGVVIDAGGWFGPVTRTRLRFTQALDRTACVEQVASRSYLAVLPEERRRTVLVEPIRLPYLVDPFFARAR